MTHVWAILDYNDYSLANVIVFSSLTKLIAHINKTHPNSSVIFTNNATTGDIYESTTARATNEEPLAVIRKILVR